MRCGLHVRAKGPVPSETYPGTTALGRAWTCKCFNFLTYSKSGIPKKSLTLPLG